MSNMFEKWDAMVDVAGLQKDVAEAASNGGGSYVKVPHGKYEVKIEKLELAESKSQKPMVSVWFRVLDGEHKDGLIFYHQVITQGFQIHIMNQFLRELQDDVFVEFTSYSQYANLLMDVFERIDGNFEYVLDYSQNKKGFDTYTIEEAFELED